MTTKRKKPRECLVVPDSNVVYQPKPGQLISRAFTSVWEELWPTGGIQLLLPEIVVRERKFHLLKAANDSLQNAEKSKSTLEAIAGGKCCVLPSLESLRQAIEKQFSEWCKQYDVRIVPPPLNAIDWQRVVDNACSRKPPFADDKSEKGFRDYLLLETFLHVASSHPEKDVAFLCNDKLLITAAQERLPENAIIRESLESFGSFLRLGHEVLAKAFVERLLDKVSNVFFTLGDPECVYEKFAVLNQIRQQFGSSLTNPVEGGIGGLFESITNVLGTVNRWTPTSEESPFVYPPEFEKLTGKDRFCWKSQVEIARLFGTDAKRTLRNERLLKAKFNVFWSAKISDDAEFSEFALQEITEGERTFESTTIEEKEEYGFEVDPLERILREAASTNDSAILTSGVALAEPAQPNSTPYLDYLAPIRIRSKPEE